MSANKIPLDFYTGTDTLKIAQVLLGKVIYTRISGQLTAGIITETEAYLGIEDRASHAFGGRRTSRTAVMYQRGGVAYVYLCYGIHALFNVVTHSRDEPHAVLIRAVEPFEGAAAMLQRRNLIHQTAGAFKGPGKVSQALGITCAHTGISLTGGKIWIGDEGINFKKSDILTSPRIGVDYAGSDALLPYRFEVRVRPGQFNT